jgi:hypothetical protein
MVHVSMDVDIYNVSICGWANNQDNKLLIFSFS